MKLLEEAVAAFKALSPEEQEHMIAAQKESFIRAEMSWPKSKFHYENGVKVYHSYEDYCND